MNRLEALQTVLDLFKEQMEQQKNMITSISRGAGKTLLLNLFESGMEYGYHKISIIEREIFRYKTQHPDSRVYNRKIDPELGDVFTVKEWEEEIKNNTCMNSDGCGYWAKDGFFSYEDEVFSTEPLDATHVVWFNK